MYFVCKMTYCNFSRDTSRAVFPNFKMPSKADVSTSNEYFELVVIKLELIKSVHWIPGRLDQDYKVRFIVPILLY